MPTRSLRLAIASLLVIPLTLVQGCGTRLDPIADRSHPLPAALNTPEVGILPLGGAANPSSAFYPLQSGNHWDYDHTSTLDVIPLTGTTSHYQFHSTIASDQTCLETVAGREYLIERHVETGPGGLYVLWIRFRQDRAGLYEADLTDRPTCESAPASGMSAAPEIGSIGPQGGPYPRTRDLLAGVPANRRPAWAAAIERVTERRTQVLGALRLSARGARVVAPPAGELLRLSYPLRPGTSWVLRPDPEFTERVEGIDGLRTPAGTFVAYRIAIRVPLMGDQDHVFVWYGRQGFLGLDAHFEFQATDETGGVIGTAVSDEQETLTGLALVPAP